MRACAVLDEAQPGHCCHQEHVAHRPEAVELSAADAEALGVVEGERVLVSSRRGEVEAPVHLSSALRRGLAFMTLHFPDEVETNKLTIDATDPRSGTAEFKATAIRIEKLPSGAQAV